MAAAGWDLISHQVYRRPEVLDLSSLLDTIEAQMRDAPKDLQWSMNNTLAAIGIENPDLRDRALAIGERLEVLRQPHSPELHLSLRPSLDLRDGAAERRSRPTRGRVSLIGGEARGRLVG